MTWTHEKLSTLKAQWVNLMTYNTPEIKYIKSTVS